MRYLLLGLVILALSRSSFAQDPCKPSSVSQRLSVPSVGTAVLRLPSGNRIVGGTVGGKPMLQVVDANLSVIRTFRLDFTGGLTDGHVYSLYYDPAGFVLAHTYHILGGSIEMGVVKVSADLQRVVWSRHFAGTNQNVLFSTLQIDGRGDYLMSGSRVGTFNSSSGCDALLLTLDEATGQTKASVSGHAGSCDDWLQLRQVNGSVYAVGRWDPDNTSTAGYRMSLTKFTPDRRGVEWVKYYVAPGTATARCYALDLVATSNGLALVGIGDKDGIDVLGSDAIIVSTDLTGKAQRIDFFEIPILNAREAISQVASMTQGLRLGGAYMKEGFIYNFVAQLDADNKIAWASSVALDRYTISQSDYAIALGKRFDFFEDRTDIYGTTVDQGITYSASLSLDALGRSTSSCSVVEPLTINQVTERTPVTYTSRFEVSRKVIDLATRPLTFVQQEASSVPICSSNRASSRRASFCAGAKVQLDNNDPLKRDVSFRPTDSTAAKLVCSECPNSTILAKRSGTFLFGDVTKPCLVPDTLTIAVSLLDTAYRTVVSCEPSVRLPDGSIVYESGQYATIKRTAGSCDSTIVNSVILGSAPSVPFRAAFCSGDSLKLFGEVYGAGGAYQHVIQNGACAKTINITLTEYPRYQFSDSRESCSERGFELEGSRWFPGDIYARTLKTARGCDSTLITTFVTGTEPRSTAQYSICEGDIHRFAGETFTAPGSYERRFARTQQCDSIATHELEVRPPARGQTVYAGCAGDTLRVLNFTLVRDTTWQVVSVGSNGCDSIHTNLAHFRNPPVATLDTLLPACDDTASGSIGLTIADTITLRWLDGAPERDRRSLPAGDYTALLNDSSGCTSEITYTVQQRTSVGVSSSFEAPKCRGDLNGYVRLRPADSIQHSVLGTRSSSDHRYDNLGAGSYRVGYVDVRGCRGTRLVDIPEGRDPPLVSHASPVGVMLGDSIRLDPVYGTGDSLQWIAPMPLSCYDCPRPWASPVHNSEIDLIATNAGGCSTSAKINLIVDDGPRIYTPNVFSPNDDGINDFWLPRGRVNVDRILELSIYDRWGELIFTQSNTSLEDPALGWDGTLRNQALDGGVFVYVCKYILKNGEVISTHGEITLVK